MNKNILVHTIFVFIMLYPAILAGQNHTMFNELGIGNIQLGKNISEIPTLIPLMDFGQKNDYIPSPDANPFYVFTGEISELIDSPGSVNIMDQIFVAVDNNNEICLIIIHFSNNLEYNLLDLLNRCYGEPNSLGKASAEGINIRQHAFWNLAASGVIVALSNSLTLNKDIYPTVRFQRIKDVPLVNHLHVVKRTWPRPD